MGGLGGGAMGGLGGGAMAGMNGGAMGGMNGGAMGGLGGGAIGGMTGGAMGGLGGGAMGGIGGSAMAGMGGRPMSGLGGATMGGFGGGAMGGFGGGAMGGFGGGAMGGLGGGAMGGMGAASPFGMDSGFQSAGVGLASGLSNGPSSSWSSSTSGLGSSQTGWGSSQGGWGSSQSGWGSSQSGWGSSQASSSSSGWSPVSSSSSTGSSGTAGFGAAGFGAGRIPFPSTGFGARLPLTGLTGGAAGLGWGFNPLQGIQNTTMTCAFTATGFTGSVTLRRSAWGMVRRGVSGSLNLRSTTATGTYNVVVTERSRTEAGCTSDGLGPVIAGNQRWNLWSMGMGSQNPGVLATVTLSANQQNNVNLANLPLNNLELYGGRGLAICSTLTTGVDGRQVCSDPIAACCKLGFDNQEAVTP
ncbi:glycine-rich cell wall structural protein-like [Haliotis rubra]|uniref:glycine-rich cell wall structural protein-like n=1 Tax=Haliotis rubra TaxID=36100 RepID=UPI001EE61EE1|nr:glycine-rich cell wall structural protein-like [Haliotis rubra]